jgi:hypothetical protein
MKKILLASIALATIGTSAMADETMKLHAVLHGVNIQSIPIGDVEGHQLAISKFAGLATLADGTIFKINFTSTADGNPAQKAHFKYYYQLSSDEGSIWLVGDANVERKGDKYPLGGSFTIASGTGKYANAKGEGTFTGTRVSPLVTGVAESFNDITINLGNNSDTPEQAKAMLNKAIAAVKADREVALGMFNRGEGGFRNGDLYPFCNRIADGRMVAGPVYIPLGADVRNIKDSTGYPYGLETTEGGAKHKEGEIFEISYRGPKPGTTAPEYPKTTYLAKVGDLVCGVGYYK